MVWRSIIHFNLSGSKTLHYAGIAALFVRDSGSAEAAIKGTCFTVIFTVAYLIGNNPSIHPVASFFMFRNYTKRLILILSGTHLKNPVIFDCF